jgi:hypothetical protein
VKQAKRNRKMRKIRRLRRIKQERSYQEIIGSIDSMAEF